MQTDNEDLYNRIERLTMQRDEARDECNVAVGKIDSLEKACGERGTSLLSLESLMAQLQGERDRANIRTNQEYQRRLIAERLLEEARLDTARFDWLEAQHLSSGYTLQIPKGKTVRESVDSAMNPPDPNAERIAGLRQTIEQAQAELTALTGEVPNDGWDKVNCDE